MNATITPAACARCQRTIALHARGLCSNCYASHRDEFPRSKIHRAYTAKERAFIQSNWGAKSCKEIAATLDRNVIDVYAAAVRFGATKPRRVPKTDPALREQLVKFHRRGLSDREIGKKVGFGHGTVSRWLRRLGLPSNCRTKPTDPFPERTRLKLQKVALKRIKEEGLEFAVPFLRKHLENRIKAMEMGWRQANTLLEARILESLFQHGASSAAQVANELRAGRNWTGSVVRDLKRRRVIAVWYRENHVCYYGLTAGLRKHWEREGL